jgi:hypothetical protein
MIQCLEIKWRYSSKEGCVARVIVHPQQAGLSLMTFRQVTGQQRGSSSWQRMGSRGDAHRVRHSIALKAPSTELRWRFSLSGRCIGLRHTRLRQRTGRYSTMFRRVIGRRHGSSSWLPTGSRVDVQRVHQCIVQRAPLQGRRWRCS